MVPGAFSGLSIPAQERRDFETAETWYLKSLGINEKLGNEADAAKTHGQLGHIAMEQRNLDKAEEEYLKVVSYFESIGDEITFGAMTNPPSCAHLVPVSWNLDGGTQTAGGGSQITAYWNTPGPKTVTATCGTSDESKNVTIVQMGHLQYDQPVVGYTDVSGTMYVLQGTTVTFKAIPDPCGVSWPAGKPVWGGTAGASGTGETKAVTFNTLSSTLSDYKTVTSECGNTVMANVIVYQLQGIPTPNVIFDGRNYDNYGVEETVALAHTTYPSGINDLPLEWKVHSGVGSISISGTTYDAGAVAGDITLKLELQSGPNKGYFHLYGKTVVAPAYRFARHRTLTGTWHLEGHHSVGFKGEYFLDPKNVSFTNIKVREADSTPAECDGLFSDANGYIHPEGDWCTPTGPNTSTGCHVGQDTCSFDKGPGGTIGQTGTWTGYFIDLEYKGDDDEPNK